MTKTRSKPFLSYFLMPFCGKMQVQRLNERLPHGNVGNEFVLSTNQQHKLKTTGLAVVFGNYSSLDVRRFPSE